MRPEQTTSGTDYLRGSLAAVIFHRDNFAILRITPEGPLPKEVAPGADGTVAAKGPMIAPQPHASYQFTGAWERHPKWGAQFAFSEYAISYPSRAEDVVSYLRELPGIGAVLADRIVATLGAEAAIQALREEPERTSERVAGLSAAVAREAAVRLAENREIEGSLLELKHLLGGCGIGRSCVLRVLRKWGKKAPEQIQRDPYILAREIWGIGFHSADQVARRAGLPLDDPRRIRAGMAWVLDRASASEGHTCLPCRAFLRYAAELLGVADEQVMALLAQAYHDGSVQVVVEEGDPEPPDGGWIYLPALMRSEHAVSAALVGLLSAPPGAWERSLVPASGDGLAEDQRAALALACQPESRVFLLTGPPGTGKTFALKALLGSYAGAGVRVALSAPTGKAAKRMMEATGRAASTIHALLKPQRRGEGGEVEPGEGDAGGAWHFKHGPGHPLEIDVLVLDEVSMLDVSLARSVFGAVPLGARLVLVGDADQLPSVGPGNVLADLVASEAVPHARLSSIKRQDPGAIVTNCHRVREGRPPKFPGGDADMIIVPATEPEEIRAALVRLVAEELPKRLGLTERNEILAGIQVLSPLREKTELGCDKLNALLQDTLNPALPGPNGNLPPEGVDWGRSAKFRVGDKVIQTRNDYDLQAINGDLGSVLQFLPQGEEVPGAAADGSPAVRVAFENPNRERVVPAKKNDLELAYALTVHKYQGSEAPCVVLPMHRCFGSLVVQRNWVYTAISRAAKLCVVVGSEAALRAGVKRVSQRQRCSRLACLLACGAADADEGRTDGGVVPPEAAGAEVGSDAPAASTPLAAPAPPAAPVLAPPPPPPAEPPPAEPAPAEPAGLDRAFAILELCGVDRDPRWEAEDVLAEIQAFPDSSEVARLKRALARAGGKGPARREAWRRVEWARRIEAALGAE